MKKDGAIHIHADINKMCQHNIHYGFLFFTLTLFFWCTISEMYNAYSQQRQPHIHTMRKLCAAKTMSSTVLTYIIYTFVSSRCMWPEKVQFHFRIAKNMENLIQFRHIAFIILLCLSNFGSKKRPISIGNVTKFKTHTHTTIKNYGFYQFKFHHQILYSIQKWIYNTFYLSWIVLILVTSMILLHKPYIAQKPVGIPMIALKRIAIAWLYAIN